MPRDLSVAPDGRLHIVPVPEISNLKTGAPKSLVMNGVAQTLGAQVMVQLACSGLPQAAAASAVRSQSRTPTLARAHAARSVGVDILLDAGAGEWTRVGYDLNSGVLFVDQSHTNAINPALSDAVQRSAPLHEVTGQAHVATLNITVLVDGGVVESYANSQVVISSLISPSNHSSSEPSARQVRAFAAGVSAGVACSGEAWRMRSVPH